MDRTLRDTVKCKHFYSAYTNSLNPINLVSTRNNDFEDPEGETEPPPPEIPVLPVSLRGVSVQDVNNNDDRDKVSEINGNAEIVLDWNNLTTTGNETIQGLKPYKINLNFNFKINSSQM